MEGIEFRALISPQMIVFEPGKAVGIVFMKMRMTSHDKNVAESGPTGETMEIRPTQLSPL